MLCWLLLLLVVLHGLYTGERRRVQFQGLEPPHESSSLSSYSRLYSFISSLSHCFTFLWIRGLLYPGSGAVVQVRMWPGTVISVSPLSTSSTKFLGRFLIPAALSLSFCLHISNSFFLWSKIQSFNLSVAGCRLILLRSALVRSDNFSSSKRRFSGQGQIKLTVDLATLKRSASLLTVFVAGSCSRKNRNSLT